MTRRIEDPSPDVTTAAGDPIAAGLAALYNPFPPQRSPLLPEIAADALAWAEGFGLLQGPGARRRFSAALYADFAARVYPDAALAELCLATRWCAWLFLFDDHFDDSYLGRGQGDAHGVLERLLLQVAAMSAGSGDCGDCGDCGDPGAPSGLGPPRRSPVERSLEALWRATAPSRSPGWRRRFAGHLGDYLRSYFWEVGNRAARVAPDLTLYIEMRRDTGATWIGLDLIEVTTGAEVPPQVYASFPLRTLNLTAIDAICWTNDIASYAKERARGEVNNLVYIAERLFEVPLAEAVAIVQRLQDSRVALFVATAAELSAQEERLAWRPAEAAAVRGYVAGLAAWIRGNLDWSLATARYLEVERRPEGGRVSWAENISLTADGALAAPGPS